MPVCGIFNLKESAGGECRDLSGARQRLSDTTGLYCQRVIRCQRYFRAGHQPVSPGYTKPGAYEVLSVEKQPDGYVIRYTYGDFYSHDAIRSSRITVENGEMVITDIA